MAVTELERDWLVDEGAAFREILLQRLDDLKDGLNEKVDGIQAQLVRMRIDLDNYTLVKVHEAQVESLKSLITANQLTSKTETNVVKSDVAVLSSRWGKIMGLGLTLLGAVGVDIVLRILALK